MGSSRETDEGHSNILVSKLNGDFSSAGWVVETVMILETFGDGDDATTTSMVMMMMMMMMMTLRLQGWK